MRMGSVREPMSEFCIRDQGGEGGGRIIILDGAGKTYRRYQAVKKGR